MANFRDALELFCRETGRHDLVADFAAGDFSDRGAGAYINSGIEMLDRRYFRFLGADVVYTTTLAAGTSRFAVPLLRQANAIWLRASSSASAAKTRVEKCTHIAMLDFYKKDVEQNTAGLPCKYARTGGTAQITATGAAPDLGEDLYDNTEHGQVDDFDGEGLTATAQRAVRAYALFAVFDTDENGQIAYADITSPGSFTEADFDAIDTLSLGYLTKAVLLAYLKSEFTPFSRAPGWYWTHDFAPIVSADSFEVDVTSSGESSLEYIYVASPMSIDMDDPDADDSLGYPVVLEFDLEMAYGSAGMAVIDVSGFASAIRAYGAYAFAPEAVTSQLVVTSAGHYVLTLPNLSAQVFSLVFYRDCVLSNITLKPVSSYVSGASFSLTGEEILFDKPLAEEMVVDVHGYFRTAELTTLTSTNRWLERHPTLVNLCAQYQHEVSMSNMTRVRELLSVINEELKFLNMDEIDEENPDDGSYVEIEG